MAEDLSKGNRRDPGWKYNYLKDPDDTTRVTCNFCRKTTTGGINRAKQHLIGNFRNAMKCKKCPEEVREELKNYMEEKKIRKEVYTNEFPEFDEFEYQDNVGGEDEVQEINHNKRGRGSFPSGFNKKLAKEKGPMDMFLQKHGTLRQTNIKDSCDKEARAMTIQKVARFFYDNGIPFNVARSKSFKEAIEAVGREEWVKYGTSIMAYGWTIKIENFDKLLIDMWNTLEKRNVVQIVSDNGSNFVLVVNSYRRRPHIFWTPCISLYRSYVRRHRKIPIIEDPPKAIALARFHLWTLRVLNMMRDFTKSKELVKCGITRFATKFSRLCNGCIVKNKFAKAMFTSDKWVISRWAKLPGEKCNTYCLDGKHSESSF
ncbi:hypothetical protein H5410_007067 [Solanum commersonii]|uniref:BED-type domain-containing protein n=1 Tax=Solanum commersonii TaxID=4109 RepID=A0A9J6ABK6_SOLCO|nr:hypothetical protein H5410_007067 [Solanum commersonii]